MLGKFILAAWRASQIVCCLSSPDVPRLPQDGGPIHHAIGRSSAADVRVADHVRSAPALSHAHVLVYRPIRSDVARAGAYSCPDFSTPKAR